MGREEDGSLGAKPPPLRLPNTGKLHRGLKREKQHLRLGGRRFMAASFREAGSHRPTTCTPPRRVASHPRRWSLEPHGNEVPPREEGPGGPKFSATGAAETPHHGKTHTFTKNQVAGPGGDHPSCSHIPASSSHPGLPSGQALPTLPSAAPAFTPPD